MRDGWKVGGMGRPHLLSIPRDIWKQSGNMEHDFVSLPFCVDGVCAGVVAFLASLLSVCYDKL